MGKKLYTYNENFFADINHTSAYVAGFVTADGCVSIKKTGQYSLTFGLQAKDVEVLNFIKTALEYSGPIRFVEVLDKRYNRWYQKVRLCIYSRKMCEDLINIWHVIPRKTGFEKLPNLDDTFLHSYMRGLFDGDGSITLRKGYSLYTRIFSANPDFLYEIQSRFYGMGVVEPTASCYHWRMCTSDSLVFRDLIYADSGFALKRKKNRMFSVNKTYRKQAS